MKKSIMLTITILLIGIISLSYVASAVPNKGINNPFNKILGDIGELREGVNNIWDSIFGLQEQIDNIESVPGEQGIQGEPGPQGERGLPGISEMRIAVFNMSVDVNMGYDEENLKKEVSCNDDEFATGGGVHPIVDTTGLHSYNPAGFQYHFYPIDEKTWKVVTSNNWGLYEIRLVCVKYNSGILQ